ncbi:MAG: aminoglycoside phosphotransferase family protein, partial [Candidatus Bathyarchaeia archaeon]
MLELKAERVEEYLSSVYKAAVKVLRVVPLRSGQVADLKGFGYGVPYLIEFSLHGQTKRSVLETVRPEGFGHDY